MLDISNGEIKDKIHHYKTRICFYHTDAGGIVYHSRYLDMAEEARGAFLRLIDCEGSGIVKENEKRLAYALKSSEIQYIRPAKLDDIVEIRTNLDELKKASMVVSQEFFVKDVKTTSIKIKLACVDIDNGRPNKLPLRVLEKLEDYVN